MDPLLLTPGQVQEVEKSTVSAMMLDEQAIPIAASIIKDGKAFKDRRLGIIFDAIVELFNEEKPVDQISVAEKLMELKKLDSAGGVVGVAQVASAVYTWANISMHAGIIADRAVRRNVILMLRQKLQDAEKPDIDTMELVESISVGLQDTADPVAKATKHISSYVDDAVSRIGNVKLDLKTYFGELDDKLFLYRRAYIIIAARTSIGKTAFVLQLALKFGYARKGVAIFSLEMSAEENMDRLIAYATPVNAQKLMFGEVGEEVTKEAKTRAIQLKGLPIFINEDPELCPSQLLFELRRLKSEHDVRVAIVDYIQLMQPDPGKSNLNRERELSKISRSLQIIAKRLSITMIVVAQLSRKTEERENKRPELQDLRESGCLHGDTIITKSDGSIACIKDLVGERPEILSVDKDGKLVNTRAKKVWETGQREVYELILRSGSRIKATVNHPFLKLDGYVSLGDLKIGDRVAVCRGLPSPNGTFFNKEELVLLAHLIGDGCYVSKQPIHYTSQSKVNLDIVEKCAFNLFDITAKRICSKGCWSSYFGNDGNRWHQNALKLWLESMGIHGQRSKTKVIPKMVYESTFEDTCLFLRHLWATDGSNYVNRSSKRPIPVIYYSTSSLELAMGVKHLLLRIGIVARINIAKKMGYSDSYHVKVSGIEHQKRFIHFIGGFGDRKEELKPVGQLIESTSGHVPNVDTIPKEIWTKVKTRMRQQKITQRQMAELRGTKYGGTSHFSYNPSRETIKDYGIKLKCPELFALGDSDIFWDEVKSVEKAGEFPVYDIEVSKYHNFIANGIVVHNSLEQDSDAVVFLYRPEASGAMLDLDAQEESGAAFAIIAKQRNGPKGQARLKWNDELAFFEAVK